MSFEAFLLAVGMAVGAIVWLVRLEGRINLAEGGAASHASEDAEHFALLRDDIKEIKADVKQLLRQ